MSSWKSQVLRDLIESRDLPDNWDDDGAKKTSYESFKGAFSLLSVLPDSSSEIPFFVRPNIATGNMIMVIGSKDDKQFVEIEFLKEGGLAYYANVDGIIAKGTATLRTNIKDIKI